MISTDKERSLIKEWAVKNEGRIEVFDENEDSFWSECESSGDILEYDFKNITELKKMFEELLIGCKDVTLPLSVVTFKMKDMVDVVKVSDLKEKSYGGDFEIPEYIYVF